MKIKNILLIITGLFFALSSVGAEYSVYDNLQDFENAKWNVCEAATDGCNNYFLQDWKIAWWTKMYCENQKVEWTCTKFKDDVMTTLSIQTTNIDNTSNDEVGACTMDYTPVCWEIEIQCITTPCNNIRETFSNKCVAEQSNAINIVQWECKNKLSQNDENFYNSIKNRLEIKYQNKVNNTLEKYIQKLEKYSKIKKERITSRIIKLLDQNISQLLLKYPQDVALPEKVNNVYMVLKLFKFELMKLDF